MKTRLQTSLRTISAGLGLVLSLLAFNAGAVSDVWWDNAGTGAATNGNWDTTTKNWATNGTLTASTFVFTNGNFPEFAAGSGTTTALTINVPGPVTCAGMADGLNAATVTTLTFTNVGPITIASGSQGFYCGPSSSDTVTFLTVLTGSGGVQQHSNGTLALYATNTYTGGTWLTGGQVVDYNNNGSFGTGAIYVGGTAGAIQNTSVNALVIPNAITFSNNANYSLNLAGGNPVAGAPGTTFTGPVTLPTSGNILLYTSSTATEVDEISGAISGASGLQIADAGTMELAGTNTYTGGTSNCTTLIIVGSGSLGSGSYAGPITNGAAFIYNSLVAQTLSGVISGAGGLSQYGPGNLTLTAAETYTGGTSNSAALIISGGGTITAAGKLTNNGAFYYNSTNGETISGVISGTGTLNLNGTGGLTLSGANTYTGITTVTNGLLAISSDGNLGTAPASAVANSITLNSGTTGANYGLRIAGNVTLNPNRGITLGSSGAAIQVAANDTLTYNGIITGSGNLYMGPNFNTGSGTLILGGANTYSGTTTIACGILQLGASGALPSGTPLVVASSTSGTGIFNLTNFNQTIGPLSSSPGIAGTGTNGPTITLGNSGTLTINETSNTTFAGVISGGTTGGGVNLNAGGNALTLTGASTYSSPTMINSGELIGVAGGGVTNSVVTVASGATNSVLITNNANQWICGGLTFNAGTLVLDFNFGYSVTPSTSVAPLNVINAATFTGTPIVTVEAGSLPGGAGTYPLMTWTSTSGTPPTTAILPPHVTGNLTVSGNTLYLNATNAQPIRWTGAAGNGLWDIATSQNWDDNMGNPTDYLQTPLPGDAVVLDETYITNSAAIMLNTVVTPASVTVSNTIYNYSISGTGGITGAASFTKLGSGTLTLACTNTYTGRTTNIGGTLIVGADNNLGTAPASATVSSIVLSNSTLSANNTFTLSANRGITMLANSTLDVAGGDQLNYSGIIAGPANLTKTSPGTLVLGGNNNSYTGNTIVSAGILQTGGDHTNSVASNFGVPPSAYAPTNITLAGGTLQGNNANFSFNTNRGIVLLANSGLSSLSGDIMGIPGGISGNFGLTISNLGTGVVYLTGTNTYTGNTLVVTGLLSLQVGGSLSNSSLNIAAGAGFDVSKLTITNFTVGGTSFAASGNGTVTNIGTANAAQINGASGGSVSLGSLPISLTYTPATFTGDATNPSLYVSQGTLQLNGNSFTVNNASGTPLGGGTYVLIKQNGGSISSSDSYMVSVTGSGIVAGLGASISVSGTTVNLIVQSPAAFSNLIASPSTTYGTTSLALGGKVSATGPLYPATNETIIVTINGIAQSTNFSDTTGDFSIVYNPATIPYSASMYTVSYSYAGDASLTPATNTSTALTVNQRPLTVTTTGVNKNYDGTTAAAVTLSDNRVNGDVFTDSYTSAAFATPGPGTGIAVSVTGISISGPGAGNYTYNTTASTTASILSPNATWDGSDFVNSPNWSDGTNWVSGYSPDLVGDSIVFAGTTGLMPVMDSSYTAYSLTFSSNAGPFVLTNSGGSVLTATTVTNNSTNTVTLAMPVVLGAASPASWAIFNADKSIVVSGRISDSGGGLAMVGNSTLSLEGSNTYAGPTIISSGRVEIDGAGQLGGGAYAGNITNGGTFNYAGTNAQTLSGIISGSGALNENGAGTITLSGANTYTGNTTINAGTLALTGAGTIGGSTNLTIAGGATLDVSGLASAPTLISGLTLSNSTSTAAVNGSLNSGSATLSLTYASGTPSFTVTGGTLTLSNLTVINVNNRGSILPHGSYLLISAGAGGSVAGTVPSSVVVSGGGITAGAMPSLSISGGQLYLVVPDQAPTIANPVVTESAPVALVWKIAIKNLASAAGWGDPDGDTVTLSSVGPTSTNGVSVTSDANYVYYNAVMTVADQFAYTITDGTLTATGTVNLAPVDVPSPNIISPTVNGSGNPTFSGYAIPAYVYGVESETNLLGPWFEAGTATAGTNGAWMFTDLTQTNPPAIFYRLYYPDNPGNPPQ